MGLLPALRAALVAGLVLAGCGGAGVPDARPVSAEAAKTDLAAAERFGGHTLTRHVDRGDGELRERLTRCRNDASPQEVQKLAEEWRRLSVNTANWTVADIGSLLTRDFGGAWMSDSKQDLARLFQVIRSAAASGTHA